MAEGHPPAAAMASYRRSRLPFARPQTLQTLQKSAQLRREKVPQQAQHAPLLATPNAAGKSHHKATAMAQEHPTAAAMAIRASYRRSRLPFARTQKPPQGHSNGWRAPPAAAIPHAQATTRPQQWLKGTPRPQQWLLIGVQGCRLPGLKRSKRSKSPPSSAGKRYPNKPKTRHSLPRPTLQAKATTRPQQWLKSTPRPQQWPIL